MFKLWSLSALLAERFTSQASDCWEVACTLDTTGNPVADDYSRSATRYAVAAGYLRSRDKRDRPAVV